jgi:transcription antitermination factor NusG
MEWYAIQLITGKERQVISALNDWNVETLNPQRPVIFKFHDRLRVEYKPLMPGYIIAKLKVTDFYIYKRNLRIEKMMIRLCGLEYEAVPLNNSEIGFISRINRKMQPLLIRRNAESKGYYHFNIIDPPSWAESTYIEWYDSDRFKVRLKVKSNGALKDHIFNTAAFDVDYDGKFKTQLKDLLNECTASSGISEYRLT